MKNNKYHIVTGGLGFSGKYIIQKLLSKGLKVKTLTNSLYRENPFGNKIEVLPFNFENQKKLIQSLQGAEVLYNTYWIRFNHKTFSHQEAVNNTLALFEAAKIAGVRRIVHTSITNPDEKSPLEYFHGKALLEKDLKESGISYAILRPAVIFGDEDILIHNIAWMINKFPIMGYFGNGKYRLQPIHVLDFAELAVQSGAENQSVIINAIGPETFSYHELMELVAEKIGKKRLFIPIPPFLGYWLSWLVGKLKKDILITKEEIKGLMADLLYVDSKPTGKIKLSQWIEDNKEILGKNYRSELARRRDHLKSYQEL
jgi:NADH dehydrogenase